MEKRNKNPRFATPAVRVHRAFLSLQTRAQKKRYFLPPFGEFTECALAGINWGLLQPAGRFSEPISRMERCRLKYNFFSDLSLARFGFSVSERLTYELILE